MSRGSFRVIGEREQFADDLQQMMAAVSFNGSEHTIEFVCAPLASAVDGFIDGYRQRLAQQAVDGDVCAFTGIDEEHFSGELSLRHLSEPDLLIRTGGDYRISNFLLWDLAYTELYFTEVFGQTLTPLLCETR